MEPEFILRRWQRRDCAMIYAWRMEPAVRKESFNQNEFFYEEHEKWFEAFLKNKLVFGYILEACGKPVAQIRFDTTKIEGYYNISVFTAPNMQGKGYGNAILGLALADKELLKLAKFFVAEVFADNVPSNRLFLKNAFVKTSEATVQGSKVFLYHRKVE